MKTDYFGRIVDGEMILNKLGQKLKELIEDIRTHNPYSEIPVYQVMPNHVHLIVCVNGTRRDAACHVSTKPDVTCHGTKNTDHPQQPVETRHATSLPENGINEKMQDIAYKCGLLSTTMGGLKSATTKYANDHHIEFGWQTRFYDHIIRDQNEMNRIATYIENNPTTWKNDKFYSV
ncbi:MAG: hypothetical protein GZ091_17620 [Paludibacter sp.]|nr:hypothetical protein [Paludibacter sp.]